MTEAELFKVISGRVGSSATAHIEYLVELEVDSKAYEWLDYEDIRIQSKVRGVRNAFSVPQFVDSVRALAIMGVSVVNSTLMSAVRKYESSSVVTDAQLIRVARLLENFHFQFNALTNSGSTGGTRGRYNRFAVRLEEARNKSEVASAVDDLAKRLRDSLPVREAVEKAFVELFYAPSLRLNQDQKLRGRKIFIAYVLMELARADGRMSAGQNLTSWTIEHIKPQAMAGDDRRDPIYSVGNLTLLPGELNSSLGSKALMEKLTILQKNNPFFDSDLAAWASTGSDVVSDDQIRSRASALATKALDQVWSV